MAINVDSIFEKAKETLEVVAKTTKKTAVVSKKKMNIAIIHNKLDKSYQALGKAYFNSLENESGDEVASAVNQVKELLAELETAKQELEKEKED